MSKSLLAKKVIVEIIRQAGGSLTGATRLYKAFYLAHLYYFDDQPGYLTEWPMVHLPNGPGIDEGDELLNELRTTGIIRIDAEPVGPYTALAYALTGKELPGDPLAAEAVSAIKKATDFVKTRTATELSDIMHEFSRSWKKTENGREMNIYIDLIPEIEFNERHRRIESLRHQSAVPVSE